VVVRRPKIQAGSLGPDGADRPQVADFVELDQPVSAEALANRALEDFDTWLAQNPKPTQPIRINKGFDKLTRRAGELIVEGLHERGVPAMLIDE
jgi:hypothetical protein